MAVRLDLDDIQGIVARGYGGLGAACYVLLAIGDPGEAGAWLGSLAADVTNAAERPAGQALNVALTAEGLRHLGLPAETLGKFSVEFTGGMTTAHRSRLLGDVGECAPDRWSWGGPTTTPVHVLLALFAEDRAALAALHQASVRRFREHGLAEVGTLDTADLDGIEPFGFRDSISQPMVEGLSRTGSPANTVAAGEFVLGYPNGYGRYTSRPVLGPADDPTGILPRDPDGSHRPDLGRNGSYLVFRQLAQDTSGFWRFVERATASGDGTADLEASLRLAAKMVGRWPGGAPLALAPEDDDPALADANDFGYFAEDRHGERCPVGAHVRRAHPRDSLDPRPGSQASIEIGNRHRILRRGREYGSPAPVVGDPSTAPADAGEVEVGLHFLCLNANLSRQFEFVQHTWIGNPNFGGLQNERDPLVSPVSGGDFRIPQTPVRRRLSGLPRFVTVRGGAYFFLPGLRALRYLAATAGH